MLRLIIASMVIGVILTFLIILFLFFGFLPIMRGAPFVPVRKERLKMAFKLVGLKPGQKIVDLGSGDGRVLITAAKQGIEAHGFEINPFLVLRTKMKIKKEGLQNLVFCRLRSFWRRDLSSFDVVFVYGITHIMKGLEKKLQRELKPGAKVVSFIFSFPNWQPSVKENGIYVYEK